MAEAQYFPSTNVSGTQVLVSGVEVEIGDLALIGQVAGLADDHVFAELLRLAPLWTVPPDTAVKGILPFGVATAGASGPSVGTVQPSGGAGVNVLPFRAILGSRQPVTNDPKLAWQDVRSAAFTPPGLSQLVTLAPNTGSSTLWDLIYVEFNVDVGTGGVSRRIKTPNSGAPGVTTISQYLGQSLTIKVIQGTLTDTIPSMPADTIGSKYGIQLAAVRKPAGFSSSSVVATTDIHDLAYALPISGTTGAVSLRPANGNNDFGGAFPTGSSPFSWSGPGVTRPGIFLPPTMVGGLSIFALLDYNTTPSHPDGAVIDNSVDWRNRFFVVNACLGSGSFNFANDPSASSGSQCLPCGVYPYAPTASTMTPVAPVHANSFQGDITISSLGSIAAATIFSPSNGTYPNLITAAGFNIFVDMTTGALRVHLASSVPTNLRAIVEIRASSQFPNY